MPDIRRGSTLVTDIRRGATLINEIRRGSTLVWTRAGAIIDDFGRPNAAALGSGWTDDNITLTTYKTGILDGRARMSIPDGLYGAGMQTHYARYNVAALGQDNGFVETRFASKGDSAFLVAFYTTLWGRGSNSGMSNGIGLMASAGHLWIQARFIGLELPVADCGTFQPGDTARLTYVGNLYTMLLNGKSVGTWTDSSNIVTRNSSNRSMHIRTDGAQDLFGPRRFSPALEYALMGAIA